MSKTELYITTACPGVQFGSYIAPFYALKNASIHWPKSASLFLTNIPVFLQIYAEIQVYSSSHPKKPGIVDYRYTQVVNYPQVRTGAPPLKGGLGTCLFSHCAAPASGMPTLQHMKSVSTKPIASVVVDYFITYGIFLQGCPESKVEPLHYDGAVSIEPRGYSTLPQFSEMWSVYYCGEQVAVLFTAPRYDYMPHDAAQVKIENRILYTANYLTMYRHICDCIGYAHHNVSRLDIAIDSHHFGVFEFMTEEVLKFHRYELKGKAYIDPHGFRYRKGRGEYLGFVIGKSKSKKQVSVYDKTRELEKSNKHYIREFHELNGLKSENGSHCERIEIRLNSEAITDIENFDYMRLECPRYLASIVKTSVQNFFEFVSTSGYKKKCLRPVIEIIDWDCLKCVQIGHIPKRPEGIRGIKQSIHILYKQIFFGVLDRSTGESNINALVVHYDLFAWYKQKSEEWFKRLLSRHSRDKAIIVNYLDDDLVCSTSNIPFVNTEKFLCKLPIATMTQLIH